MSPSIKVSRTPISEPSRLTGGEKGPARAPARTLPQVTVSCPRGSTDVTCCELI